MAKSTAERQRKYRQRHLQSLDGTKARLSLVVDHTVLMALRRLAKHHGTTQTELIERLVMEEQRQVLNGMPSEEQDRFYDSVTA